MPKVDNILRKIDSYRKRDDKLVHKRTVLKVKSSPSSISKRRWAEFRCDPLAVGSVAQEAALSVASR